MSSPSAKRFEKRRPISRKSTILELFADHIDHYYLACAVILVIALCYKQTMLGVLSAAGMSACVLVYRADLLKLNITLLAAIAYLADATVTAFLVSQKAGIERTAQFVILAAFALGVFLYSGRLDKKRINLALTTLVTVSVIILAHVIIYHVTHGHVLTWKYLRDTKLIFSLLTFLIFALQDRFEKKEHLFHALLIGLAVVLVMSGERKALLLFVLLAALSPIKFYYKAGLGLMALSFLAYVFAFFDERSYIYRQLTSADEDMSAVPSRYFFTVSNIWDHSDLIRTFVNRNAWAQFVDHPVFGLGATGYQTWAQSVYPLAFTMNIHGEVHRIPAEGGAVGIVIVTILLTAVSYRVGMFIWNNGGLQSSALVRAPLYLFVYALCYAYSEALDTSVLILISTAAVVAASLSLKAQAPRAKVVAQPDPINQYRDARIARRSSIERDRRKENLGSSRLR